jgi:hypothetical protein
MESSDHSDGSVSLPVQSEKHHPTQADPTDTESACATPETGAFPPAPDGGRRAWLVAAGSASIFFSCLGFMNSVGVFRRFIFSPGFLDATSLPNSSRWTSTLLKAKKETNNVEQRSTTWPTSSATTVQTKSPGSAL